MKLNQQSATKTNENKKNDVPFLCFLPLYNIIIKIQVSIIYIQKQTFT